MIHQSRRVMTIGWAARFLMNTARCKGRRRRTAKSEAVAPRLNNNNKPDDGNCLHMATAKRRRKHIFRAVHDSESLRIFFEGRLM